MRPEPLLSRRASLSRLEMSPFTFISPELSIYGRMRVTPMALELEWRRALSFRKRQVVLASQVTESLVGDIA